MTGRFQVGVRGQQMIAGEPHTHAVLRAQRGGEWKTVGIFSLTEDEWIELTGYCCLLGIKVVEDAKTTLPVEVAR